MVERDGALTASDLMINSAHTGVASAGSDRGSPGSVARPCRRMATIEREGGSHHESNDQSEDHRGEKEESKRHKRGPERHP
jgi:hypothetical protein